MQSSEFLIQLLTTLGYRLPMLIALGVGMVLVFDTPAGRNRSLSLTGLGVLVFATLIGALLNIIPLLLIQTGQYSSIQGLSMVLGVAHFGVILIETVGMVMVLMALSRALRPQH